MRRLFPVKPKAAILTLLTVGCIAIFGSSALAQQSQLEIDATTSFGTFNGIEYLKYQGRFTGTAGDEHFSAPFEIIAPADPSQGNGRLLLEPFHPFVGSANVTGAIVRNRFLGKALLFGRGFSHAAICWRNLGGLHINDDETCGTFRGAPDMPAGKRFIAGFAQALKAGQATDMVGDIEHLYSIGFAAAADPLHDLLLDPLGQDLFDYSLLISTGWNLSKPPENPEPPVPVGAGRVMVLLPEADIVQFGALLRDDHAQPHYRSYEVAGGGQISAGRPGSLVGITGVHWIPVLRALFVAGDRWVTEGIEPPPSTSLVEAVAGEIDPMYARLSSGIGLARDANLNATGGIRLPDVELGRGHFIAIDPNGAWPFFSNFGTFVDLACEPLPDGGVRFTDHDTYVSQFVQVTEKLVADGFLLRDDADGMIGRATGSEVGEPGSCP